MADEERTEPANGDQPEADEPVAEEPQAEEPQAEEPAADEPVAEEPQAEEPAAEESEAEPEEPAAEPAADEPEAAAATEPDAPAPADAGQEAPAEEPPAGAKAKDLPPGAELEPISLESDRPMGAEERARLEAEAEERARLEAEATSEDADQPLARSAPRVDIAAEQSIQATGKRKSSIARVVVRAGSGKFEINRRSIEDYFPRPHLQTIARQALVTCGYEGSVDINVRVHGGGVAGQAGAIRHGVARALTEIDSELRPELKRRGFLTRDARIKERRKAGLKKARKRPQFSKR
jgi:small subunit ribosomal protein S9